jgi:hypothetical protein
VVKPLQLADTTVRQQSKLPAPVESGTPHNANCITDLNCRFLLGILITLLIVPKRCEGICKIKAKSVFAQ